MTIVNIKGTARLFRKSKPIMVSDFDEETQQRLRNIIQTIEECKSELAGLQQDVNDLKSMGIRMGKNS